jgi:hypothetical protein
VDKIPCNVAATFMVDGDERCATGDEAEWTVARYRAEAVRRLSLTIAPIGVCRDFRARPIFNGHTRGSLSAQYRSRRTRFRVSSRSLIWITVIARHPERLDDRWPPVTFLSGTRVTFLSVIYIGPPQKNHLCPVSTL